MKIPVKHPGFIDGLLQNDVEYLSLFITEQQSQRIRPEPKFFPTSRTSSARSPLTTAFSNSWSSDR